MAKVSAHANMQIGNPVFLSGNRLTESGYLKFSINMFAEWENKLARKVPFWTSKPC